MTTPEIQYRLLEDMPAAWDHTAGSLRLTVGVQKVSKPNKWWEIWTLKPRAVLGKTILHVIVQNCTMHYSRCTVSPARALANAGIHDSSQDFLLSDIHSAVSKLCIMSWEARIKQQRLDQINVRRSVVRELFGAGVQYSGLPPQEPAAVDAAYHLWLTDLEKSRELSYSVEYLASEWHNKEWVDECFRKTRTLGNSGHMAPAI